MPYQLFILDRDGVINNDSDAYVKCLADWQPIAGSLEAIAKLKRSGKLVAIATNQSGIGRGLYRQEDFDAIHRELDSLLAGLGAKIDALQHCPHDPSLNCACRKPKPLMLERILAQLAVPAQQALFIGDSLKDLHAGHNAGCDYALVLTGNGEQTRKQLAQHPELRPRACAANLAELVEQFIEP